MSVTSRQPVVYPASDRRQDHKLSIAFLAGQVNEDTRMTDSYYAPVPAPELVPVAELDFQIPYYQTERSETPSSLPPLRLDGSPCSNGPHSPPQLPRVGSFSNTNSINGISSIRGTYSWGGKDISYPCKTTSNFASINTSPIKRHESICESDSTASAPTSVASYHTASSPSDINNLQAHHNQRRRHYFQPAHASMMTTHPTRIPRPARPSYNEEQKFFIMYYRVIKKLSWPAIEDKFASFFKTRTKDGLTSVYYRIRKKWGMEEVLKTAPDDRSKVKTRAAHFSSDFLTDLGYFD
jgi:hypothetical protein